MAKPETVQPNATRTGTVDVKNNSAVNRLRDKATALRGPRGKYRCRKCHELPCVCPDPKQSKLAEPAPPADAPPASAPLFTEANSKRLLEVAFGIPVVLTNCKLWALTEEEALELSKPTADVFNEFVTVDPKWVSITLLSVSLGSILARKAVLYAAWKRAYAIERVREAQARTPEKEPEQAPPAPPKPPEDAKGPGPSASMEMLQ